MRERITKEQYLHVGSRIRQGTIGSSKQSEDGVEIQLQNQAECKSNHHIEHNDIAQDGMRRFVIFLPQTDAHERRPTDADHRSESSRNRHERIGQCQPRDGIRSHCLSDEDAVDDIVERRHHHGNNGRERILHQEFRNGLFAKCIEFIGSVLRSL